MKSFFHNLRKKLNAPFPFEDNKRKIAGLTIGISTFVALFLLLFQPFGISDLETGYKIPKILGYGLVTALAMLIVYLALPAIFKKFFKQENWTVKKEIFTLSGLILLIALFNFIYSYITCLTCRYYPESILEAIVLTISSTLAVGIFPVIAVVFINQHRFTKTHLQKAQEINKQLQNKLKQESKKSVISLKSGKNKQILIAAENLIFIEADDNYALVRYEKKSGEIEKEMIRSSLKNIEAQINRQDIVRCHKSYIVNIKRIEKISGNAQGYTLNLDTGDIQVPVSRTYARKVLPKITV